MVCERLFYRRNDLGERVKRDVASRTLAGVTAI